jgi:hypothetical protein
MNSTSLLEAFRSEVGDEKMPYFWTNEDVFRYLNEAYFTFVRLTGGIADFGSEIHPWATAELVPGEAFSPLHPSILRIVSARLRDARRKLTIVNGANVELLDNQSGRVREMVLGLRKNLARWIKVPEQADTVDLEVYRLPLMSIVCEDQELSEVEPIHHNALLDWMKHLAYGKQDADTFDEKASLRSKAMFEEYCARAKAEGERRPYHTRAIRYGGL